MKKIHCDICEEVLTIVGENLEEVCEVHNHSLTLEWGEESRLYEDVCIDCKDIIFDSIKHIRCKDE